MRVGMLAPLELRVPPVGYGGTELVVSLLTEELVRRGHEVTLFASGDSETGAKLVSVFPKFLRGTAHDRCILNNLNVAACLERANDFDIIHNHTPFEGMAMAGVVDTPMLSTLHGNMEGDLAAAFARYGGWYCAISRSAKRLLPPKDRFVGVVYNAIDCSTYPFNPGPREDYLLYLSRISEEKGTHLAIEVARRLGKRLIIAGNVNEPDRPYFEQKVLPQVDGDLVRYIGEADSRKKRELLCKARALLATITWPEPFGIFMVEAMACGTPVAAFNKGAAPEVVMDGKTGFVVETLDEMVQAVGRVGEIDPRVCRAHVEERFDTPRMVDDYLEAYERVLAAGRRRKAPGVTPSLPGIVAPLNMPPVAGA